MLWTTTVAVFLGTVIAVLAVLWLVSRGAAIRAALKERRGEPRIPAELDMELSSLGDPLVHEEVSTQNICPHGARLVTNRKWNPSDYVFVRLLPGGERSRARIAYCKPAPSDAFVVGLRFSRSIEMPTGLDHSPHLYRK